MNTNIVELNNKSTKEILLSLKERYSKILRSMKKEWNSFPESTLNVIYSNKKLKYREYKRNDEGYSVRSINSDLDKIYLLCRKKYLKEKISSVEQMCNYIEELCKLQEFEYIEDAKKYMKPNYKLICDDYYEPNYRKAREWKNEFQFKNEYKVDGLKYISDKGVKVRSKSELIIANALDKYDIVYIYEKPLVVDAVLFHPDFTIMRKFDNKIFYWEHCGLIDEEYIERHNRKIERYKEVNVDIDKNLIITYECADLQQQVQNIIENVLN